MAEQRDVQALAETVRRVLRVMDGSEFEASEFPTVAEARAATAALDGLVREHTRQEEALREIAKGLPHYINGKGVYASEVARRALSPPPVASGENEPYESFVAGQGGFVTGPHPADEETA